MACLDDLLSRLPCSRDFTLSGDGKPIFDLDTCRIMAVEALIRWPQEDGSMLMPGAFMPPVEEIGLIHPLGDWVLETAARQLRAWHDQGLILAMSANVSVNQLYPYGNVERFAALVRPHIDPRWLHLEVTESTLMVDPAAAGDNLRQGLGTGFLVQSRHPRRGTGALAAPTMGGLMSGKSPGGR